MNQIWFRKRLIKNYTTEKHYHRILVTRIVCLGLATYTFRETFYREKLSNLWARPSSKPSGHDGTKNAAAQSKCQQLFSDIHVPVDI